MTDLRHLSGLWYSSGVRRIYLWSQPDSVLRSVGSSLWDFKDAAGNIRTHTSKDRDEVIEFSEAPLPADLFAPPREFRRVRRLPEDAPMSFALRIRLGWRNFKYKFRHWR